VCGRLHRLKHSQNVTSRHVSGKLLYEVADIVLDNCGCIGDASITFEEFSNIGSTSTCIGTLLLNSMICEAVEIMLSENVRPEVYVSSNVGNIDKNEALLEKYSKYIRHL